MTCVSRHQQPQQGPNTWATSQHHNTQTAALQHLKQAPPRQHHLACYRCHHHHGYHRSYPSLSAASKRRISSAMRLALSSSLHRGEGRRGCKGRDERRSPKNGEASPRASQHAATDQPIRAQAAVQCRSRGSSKGGGSAAWWSHRALRRWRQAPTNFTAAAHQVSRLASQGTTTKSASSSPSTSTFSSVAARGATGRRLQPAPPPFRRGSSGASPSRARGRAAAGGQQDASAPLATPDSARNNNMRVRTRVGQCPLGLCTEQPAAVRK